MSNKLIALGLGGAVAAGMLALTPGIANAAAYNGVCGAGYAVIEIDSLGLGNIFLTSNGSAGKYCAVTIRNLPGAPGSSIGVQLGDMMDSGTYPDTVAGPVYATASGGCFIWGGWIDDVRSPSLTTHCG